MHAMDIYGIILAVGLRVWSWISDNWSYVLGWCVIWYYGNKIQNWINDIENRLQELESRTGVSESIDEDFY